MTGGVVMSFTYIMAKNCLVCDRLVQGMIGNMETLEECYQIYNQNHLLRDEVTLLARLAEVLGTDLRGSIWHSDVICKQCFGLVREMDSLEQRLLNFCACMRSQFVSTAAKYNIYATVSNTLPSIYLRNIIEKPLTENKAVGPDIVTREEKENEPVKIECVPDSDLFNLTSSKIQFQGKLIDVEGPLEPDRTIPVLQNDTSVKQSDDVKKKKVRTPRINNESEAELFKCIVCGLGQMNSKELSTHMNEHEQKDKPFKCSVCCIAFGYQETLDIHMKKHKTESEDWSDVKRNKFVCSLCGWIGEELEECETHITLHKALICGSCCQAVEDNASLKSHGEMCTATNKPNQDPLTCKMCDVKCADQNALKLHTQTHKHFSCVQCDVKFYRKYHLERHQAKQHGIDKVKPTSTSAKIQCPKCGILLSRKDHLKRHMKNMHDNVKNKKELSEKKWQKCNVCGLELSSSSILKQHMVIHSDQHPYSCALCGRRFKLQRYLDLHMMLHRGEKKHVCPDCGKSYAHKTGYNRHRRSHTGEKPHICEFCGQTFAHLGGLKSHILIHTGERPHRCEECGYGARTFMKLQIHKRKHTGEKPYHCEYCGKNFAYKYNFDAHLRIHRGEKRFVCEVCQKAFDRRSKYNEHMESHSSSTTVTTTTATMTTTLLAPAAYIPQMITTNLHFISPD